MPGALSRGAKAITAALTAGLGAFAVAWADQEVTTEEWVTVAIATVAAGLATYNVPNATPTPEVNP